MLGTNREYQKGGGMSVKVQLNLCVGDLVTCQQRNSTDWLGVIIGLKHDYKGQDMVKVRWTKSPSNNKYFAGEYYNWYYSDDPNEALEKVSA